ncbi:hypothetical protein ACGFRB_17175 [Streptomyces sp. NPDC048718]|uniref:hypothetical protein n=1 Tax=Streptomyces sp. NPDC048718 TaxID=3365587 RepID=UPI0037222275
MQLEVFSAVTEAYEVGAEAGLAELGALSDADVRRIAESTPGTRAVNRIAAETIELVTEPHRRTAGRPDRRRDRAVGPQSPVWSDPGF